ncbi:hypothetical protein [Bacillus dakarensis]|uniref:hypothetical protein n=1 Tax=Robertmurraya dakarensis TaxID=1926278 RepID=UPI000980F348|nr:hypothetical protein [Bacillus dakarensis]
MSMFILTLTFICIGILVFSLGFTLSAAKGQKEVKGELDASISSNVKRHVYIKNPVFLSYALAFLLWFFAIIFFGFYTGWW